MTDESTVRNQMIGYLSRREHSEYELKNKLLQKGGCNDTVEKALAFAKEHGLQSDERFSHVKARDLARRGFGSTRVRLELKSHNIHSDIIEAALVQPDIDWFEVAFRYVEKKYARKSFDKSADYQKMKARLIQRGFNYDQIKYAFESLD